MKVEESNKLQVTVKGIYCKIHKYKLKYEIVCDTINEPARMEIEPCEKCMEAK